MSRVNNNYNFCLFVVRKYVKLSNNFKMALILIDLIWFGSFSRCVHYSSRQTGPQQQRSIWAIAATQTTTCRRYKRLDPPSCPSPRTSKSKRAEVNPELIVYFSCSPRLSGTIYLLLLIFFYVFDFQVIRLEQPDMNNKFQKININFDNNNNNVTTNKSSDFVLQQSSTDNDNKLNG